MHTLDFSKVLQKISSTISEGIIATDLKGVYILY